MEIGGVRMKYTKRPSGVCAMSVEFDLNGDVVSNVSFKGGCNGNLKAVSKLVDGMTVDQIESKLKGNTCGMRPTSCADQFARLVREAYTESQNA
jgi:uncharacterized protein (TIGR03905 family)